MLGDDRVGDELHRPADVLDLRVEGTQRLGGVGASLGAARRMFEEQAALGLVDGEEEREARSAFLGKCRG